MGILLPKPLLTPSTFIKQFPPRPVPAPMPGISFPSLSAVSALSFMARPPGPEVPATREDWAHSIAQSVVTSALAESPMAKCRAPVQLALAHLRLPGDIRALKSKVSREPGGD